MLNPQLAELLEVKLLAGFEGTEFRFGDGDLIVTEKLLGLEIGERAVMLAVVAHEYRQPLLSRHVPDNPPLEGPVDFFTSNFKWRSSHVPTHNVSFHDWNCALDAEVCASIQQHFHDFPVATRGRDEERRSINHSSLVGHLLFLSNFGAGSLGVQGRNRTFLQQQPDDILMAKSTADEKQRSIVITLDFL